MVEGTGRPAVAAGGACTSVRSIYLGTRHDELLSAPSPPKHGVGPCPGPVWLSPLPPLPSCGVSGWLLVRRGESLLLSSEAWYREAHASLSLPLPLPQTNRHIGGREAGRGRCDLRRGSGGRARCGHGCGCGWSWSCRGGRSSGGSGGCGRHGCAPSTNARVTLGFLLCRFLTNPFPAGASLLADQTQGVRQARLPWRSARGPCSPVYASIGVGVDAGAQATRWNSKQN